MDLLLQTKGLLDFSLLFLEKSWIAPKSFMLKKEREKIITYKLVFQMTNKPYNRKRSDPSISTHRVYAHLVAQSSRLTLRPHGLPLPDPPVHGDSPGKNTGVRCHALLQGIFPTQGLNPGLPHCRWILYQLSHKESLS